MQERKKFLRVQDVSLIFDVNEDTVRRWAREKRIPCVRVGARVLRFREADISAMFNDDLSCKKRTQNKKPVKARRAEETNAVER